jgi:Domain of unknown function (DUF3362)
VRRRVNRISAAWARGSIGPAWHLLRQSPRGVRRGECHKVEAIKGLRQRRLHKAFLRYHDPDNWPLARGFEALSPRRPDRLGPQPAGAGPPAIRHRQGRRPSTTGARREGERLKSPTMAHGSCWSRAPQFTGLRYLGAALSILAPCLGVAVSRIVCQRGTRARLLPTIGRRSLRRSLTGTCLTLTSAPVPDHMCSRRHLKARRSCSSRYKGCIVVSDADHDTGFVGDFCETGSHDSEERPMRGAGVACSSQMFDFGPP